MGIGKQQVQPIPYDVKMLLDGKTFTYSDDIVLAASATIDFLIKTPSHLDIFVNGVDAVVFGGETVFIGYADSTVSANGTEITSITNHNSQSDKTSQTRLFSAPTITDVGIEQVKTVAYAANQPGKLSIASTRLLNRFLLNRGSDNILRVTNRDTVNATKVNLLLNFIEIEV